MCLSRVLSRWVNRLIEKIVGVSRFPDNKSKICGSMGPGQMIDSSGQVLDCSPIRKTTFAEYTSDRLKIIIKNEYNGGGSDIFWNEIKGTHLVVKNHVLLLLLCSWENVGMSIDFGSC